MFNPNRSGKKRKYRDRGPQQTRRQEQETDLGWNYNKGPSASSDVEGDGLHDKLRALHIVAHEANILRGPQAEAAAESLEVVVSYQVTEAGDSSESGSAHPRRTKSRVKDSEDMTRTGATGVLVKLRSGDELSQSSSAGVRRHTHDDPKLSIVDVDEDMDISLTTPESNSAGKSSETIWVDRYDIRLLLNSSPSIAHHTSSDRFATVTSSVRVSSPSGWSDLSSDAEDTFFFTTEETEDFRRDKRRRLIERAREERLKQRLEEDGDDDAPNDDPHDTWGGSDEEPDESQVLLMTRTATHLAGSPNPAQLEMRILANHGADSRFAFLLPRGRWRRAWAAAKDKAKRAKEKEAKAKDKQATLGGLAGYGSGSGSESKDDEGSADETSDVRTEEVTQPPSLPPPLPPSPPSFVPPPPPSVTTSNGDFDPDIAIKAARRQRAKEWAEKRRALNSGLGEVAE